MVKKIFDPLAAARTKPKSVTHLSINPAAARNEGKGEFQPYRVFPGEIFDCTNLVALEVFRGIAWDGDGRIPRAIGTLTKLKHLSLGGINFTSLPEELGQLTKLEELELYYADALEALPKSLGKLAKLRTLQCGYCEALAKLPTTIGDLRGLRELNLGHTALTTVPKELWKLTELRVLHLSDGIVKLPPGIAKLTALQTLSISSSALASIAKELPALRALTSLQINGKTKTLPAEVGQITSLVELVATYLDMTTLPSLRALTKLQTLDIAGNKLKTVVHLLTDLPKLASFDYADNPVGNNERRMIDKAMKQTPAKRKVVAVAAAPSVPKSEMIGRVASINASLTMVIADASVLVGWGGTGDGEDSDDSDWDRARVATSAREAAEIELGDDHVLALTLEMGSGIAEIFRVGETLILLEGIGDEYLEDELFHEWLVTPLVRPRKIGTVALPSQTLAINPSTDAGTKVKVKPGATAKFGDDKSGIAIHVGHASATFELEAPVESSWGEARRCRISFR